MNTIVQLIRNGLCCVKDLELLSERFPFIYDPSQMAKYSYFAMPHLSRTTPLDFFISLTQLYACIVCIFSAYRLMTSSGISKLLRLHRIIEIRTKVVTDKAVGVKTRNKGKKGEDKELLALEYQADHIITESLLTEANAAFKSTIVGLCTLSTGISFFWLSANSIHITETGWIGGVSSLVYALVLMEVALGLLLYYMLKQGKDQIKTSMRMQDLAKKIKDNVSKEKKNWLDSESFSWIHKNGGWMPFWTSSSGYGRRSEEQMYKREKEHVVTTIRAITQEEEHFVNAVGQTPEEISSRLQDEARVTKWKGYREFLYFALNFMAFYGYLMAIVCYYYDEDDKQPNFITSLKFGYTHYQADWTGNFVGDLMWTIEPIVMLSSPVLLALMTPPKTGKMKSD